MPTAHIRELRYKARHVRDIAALVGGDVTVNLTRYASEIDAEADKLVRDHEMSLVQEVETSDAARSASSKRVEK